MTSTEQLRRQLRETVHGDVAFDAVTHALYTMDASNHRLVPAGVVLPRSSEDIATTIAVCRESGTTVVTRSGGTSIGGNVTGTGTVIDTSRYLDGSSTLIHTAAQPASSPAWYSTTCGRPRTCTA